MLVLAAALCVLAACGAETATTAATGAAIKQREIEDGKKILQETRGAIDQAMEQGQQRAASGGAQP
jgi:hypothetical protein